MTIEYDTISQTSFDELHLLLDAVADEDSYNRWVKNAKIRVVDIWDVFVSVPNQYIIDWGDNIQDIILDIQNNNPDFQIPCDLSITNIDFENLELLFSAYNQSQLDKTILLFGQSWNDSDTAMISIVNTLATDKILANTELAALFKKL